MSAPEPEGVWVRYCHVHQWLSPTFYRQADWIRSCGTEHNRRTVCMTGTVGRLEYGTGAAKVAARLPEWAQATYWGRKGDEFFAAALSEDEQP